MICFPMNLLVSFSKTVYFIQNWNPTQDAVRTRLYLWMGLYNIVWSSWQISQDWSWLYIHRVDVEAGLILYVIKSQNWSGFWWYWFNFHIANGPHGDISSYQKVASDGVDSIFTLLMDRMETMQKGAPHVQLHILSAPAVCSKTS